MEKTIKKSFVIALVLALIMPIGFAFEIPFLGLEIFGSDIDSCEADRSCCQSFGLNQLCWRNDLSMNSFDAQDIQCTDKTCLFNHARKGYFYSAQGDTMAGMPILRSPQYGNVRGFSPDDGGTTEKNVWYPHKRQLFNKKNNYYTEMETLFLADAVVSDVYLKCTNKNGCKGSSAITWKAMVYDKDYDSRATDHGGVGTYQETDGIIQYVDAQGRDAFKARVYGKGWASPTYDTNWYFVPSEKPTRYTIDGRILTVIYELEYNEIKNVKFIVTVEDFKNNINEYLSDYAAKEAEAKQDFEDYVSGFKNMNLGDADKMLYYSSIYTLYSSIMPAYGELKYQYCTPNLAGYKYNSAAGFNGGTSNYNGQWEWDSSFCEMGFVSGCDSGACLEDMSAIQKNWEQSTFKNNEHYWCFSIHPDGTGIKKTSCNLNPPLWSIISYNKYLKDNKINELCEIYPNLKSNHNVIKSKRDPDNDNLFVAGAGELGRDASDLLSNTGENPLITGYMAIDAYYLSKIAKICSPAEEQTYLNKYSEIKQAYNSFYKSGTVCHTDASVNCKMIGGVIAEDMISLSIYAMMNDGFDNLVLSRLSNFKDTYYPTSIPKASSCYTATGTNNACAAGETWDGPIWQQDLYFTNEWLMNAKNKNTLPASEHTNFKNQAITLYKTLPFPAESHDSHNGQSATWGAFPHSVGGGYAIYELSGINLIKIESTPAQECIPVTEVCDNVDNDCDNIIDEDVSYSCINYATCGLIKSCSVCPGGPSESCDGIDNDCDGTIDEDCGCISGTTKQCGTTDVGECQFGTQTCESGVWQDCIGNIEPTEEILNSKDDDCDNTIDEDFNDSCDNVWDLSCYSGWPQSKWQQFIAFITGLFANLFG